MQLLTRSQGLLSLQHLNCCVSLSLWDGHAVRKHRAHEEAQLNQVFESYCPGTRLLSEQASRCFQFSADQSLPAL